jgi:hypothetical protein
LSHEAKPLKRLYVSRSPLGPRSLVLLALDDDALEFLENRELLVGRVDLGVSLLFACQETDLFKALQLTLNVAWVFLYQLGKTAHVGVKIRIFGVHHYDFSAHSTSDKNV